MDLVVCCYLYASFLGDMPCVKPPCFGIILYHLIVWVDMGFVSMAFEGPLTEGIKNGRQRGVEPCGSTGLRASVRVCLRSIEGPSSQVDRQPPSRPLTSRRHTVAISCTAQHAIGGIERDERADC